MQHGDLPIDSEIVFKESQNSLECRLISGTCVPGINLTSIRLTLLESYGRSPCAEMSSCQALAHVGLPIGSEILFEESQNL